MTRPRTCQPPDRSSEGRCLAPVRTVTEPALIPFITNREGEEAAPNNLFIASHRSGSRLYYGDESRWTATSGACCGDGAASTRMTGTAGRQGDRSGA